MGKVPSGSEKVTCEFQELETNLAEHQTFIGHIILPAVHEISCINKCFLWGL